MAPHEVLPKDLAHPRHLLAVEEPTQISGLPRAKFVYHRLSKPAWEVGASTGKYPVSMTAVQARAGMLSFSPEFPEIVIYDLVIDGNILAVQKDQEYLCIMVFQMDRYAPAWWTYDVNSDSFILEFRCTPLPRYWLHPLDEVDRSHFPLSRSGHLFRCVRLTIHRVAFVMRIQHLDPQDALPQLNAITGRISDRAAPDVHEEPCVFMGDMGDAYYELDEFSDEADQNEKLLAEGTRRLEWEIWLSEEYKILNGMEQLLLGDGQVDTPQLQKVMQQKQMALNKVQFIRWRDAEEECLKGVSVRGGGQFNTPPSQGVVQQKQAAAAKVRRITLRDAEEECLKDQKRSYDTLASGVSGLQLG